MAFGWLSERSAEKTSCPRTFYKSTHTSLWRHTTTRLANRTMSSPYWGFLWWENEESTFWSFHPLADKTNDEHLPKTFSKVMGKSLYEHLSDMWHYTFEIGAAQLRSVTEIAPKSRFSCVNRRPIRYGLVSAQKLFSMVSTQHRVRNFRSHKAIVGNPTRLKPAFRILIIFGWSPQKWGYP